MALPGMIPGAGLFTSGGITVAYRDSEYTTANQSDTWTTGSLDIGPASSDRYIIAYVYARNSSAATMSIDDIKIGGSGGTSMTQLAVQGYNTTRRVEIWGINQSSGTSTTFWIDWDFLTTTDSSGIVIYTVNGLSSFTATDVANDASANASVINDLTIPTDGIGLYFAGVENTGSTDFSISWTNAIEQQELTLTSGSYVLDTSFAIVRTPSTPTVTANFSPSPGGGTVHMLGAAFQ